MMTLWLVFSGQHPGVGGPPHPAAVASQHLPVHPPLHAAAMSHLRRPGSFPSNDPGSVLSPRSSETGALGVNMAEYVLGGSPVGNRRQMVSACIRLVYSGTSRHVSPVIENMFIALWRSFCHCVVESINSRSFAHETVKSTLMLMYELSSSEWLLWDVPP